MWFKNLIPYRFNRDFSITTETLELALESCRFSPCGSQDVSKFGFSNALGKQGLTLVHSAQNRYLICATKEEKILPGQVIKDMLDEKVALQEDQESRKITKKEKDALKDEIITNLLPRAFSRKSQIKALILPEINMLLVDSSSTTKAEELLAMLRKALGSLPIVPLRFNQQLEQSLTSWLQQGSAPAPFKVQNEAEVKSMDDEGGIVRFKQQDLGEEEVLAHLNTGKQVHKLALEFGQSAALLLQSDVTVKRLKFSEEFRAGNEDLGNEDPLARMDADFALMGAELVALVDTLTKTFGGIEEAKA